MNGASAHQPVLREEVLRLLRPTGRRILLDCTVGLGGHAEAMLESAGPEALLIGTDVDEGNLRLARQRLARFGGQVRLFLANFTQLPAVLAEAGAPKADLLLADLGISSNQLDDPGRGLSFMVDGPLDMRLDPSGPRTAADLLADLSERELADVIYAYGEERYSRRIARAIVAARASEPILRTTPLARIVQASYPAPAKRSRKGVHPATRTFQALRIAVNDELANLERLLELVPELLAPRGRAGVISFHSLEDRRVKQAFARLDKAGWARVLTKKPLTPTAQEIEKNLRSRSAKLRVIEKIV